MNIKKFRKLQKKMESLENRLKVVEKTVRQLDDSKNDKITKEEIVVLAKRNHPGERLGKILEDLEDPKIVKNIQKIKDRTDVATALGLISI